jgi:CRP-like cAMP-binding protein
MEECAEFGTHCSFAASEELFRSGSQSFDCYVIVSGLIGVGSSR